MFSKLAETIRQARDRATPQVRRPFYIGLMVGFALVVLVALGLANTESFFSMPSSFGDTATSQAIWGLKPSNLLMVLPLGAFLVVLARSFIGLKAFGLFTPMLIALAFLQIGPVMGPIVLGSSVLAGMILTPTLLKLRMTRVGFLGVLISLVVLVLVMLQALLDTKLQVDAFPVIVCALVVERWFKQWEKDGAWDAARLAFNSFMIALVIQFVMVSNLALMLIETSPILMPAITAVAIGILGRYRGLRVTEIGRFAPIWLERRRHAKNQESPDIPDGDTLPLGFQEPVPRQLELLHESVWVVGNAQDVLYAKRKPTITANDHSEVQSGPRSRASGDTPVEHAWVIRSVEDVHREQRRRKTDITPNREAQFAARSGASGQDTSTPKVWVIKSKEDV